MQKYYDFLTMEGNHHDFLRDKADRALAYVASVTLSVDWDESFYDLSEILTDAADLFSVDLEEYTYIYNVLFCAYGICI